MKFYGREDGRVTVNALLVAELMFMVILGLFLVMAVSSAVKFKADGLDNARRDAYCVQVPEVCK